ncbi:MAG TPA: alpha/beta hydrolase [Candidatus Cybelea sp.]|nr:alpha/beta hydrolase [Candidatus Cybelea sp.]
MPLDPHVKGLMDMLVAAGRPKVWQLTPPEAREAMMALAQAVDAKDIGIGRVENRELPGPASTLPIRIYSPIAPGAERLPGLVYFHGGGFVIGNLDTHEGMCRILANDSGCRVVSIDYRLAPEHRFPAAVEDAFAAVKWVAEHALELGIDPNCIAVGGDSAGGNLAAVVCQLAKSNGAPRISLQVLFCPATDATADTPSMREFAEGYMLEKSSMIWFFENYCGPNADRSDPRLSPGLAGDVSGLPPAHIHTAGFDPLRDEGKAYADRLERAGVKVRYVCHDGMVHHFYCMAGAIPYARAALKEAGAAIKAALAS